MHDASIERLSNLISDQRQSPGGSGKNRRLQPRNLFSHIHLRLAEGWFSLFLLVVIVYSTIWSVQAAGWAANLNILTLTTFLGLLIGVISAKQRRWPRLLVHVLVIIGGLLLAFWQTAGADYNGSVVALANGMRLWIALALNGGTSSDDSIFLFFITALGFLLAYTSAWLLYRTRSPWLMILANAVVLLINLSNIDPAYIVFLVVFLVASLLLLLRFNLYESSVRWKRMGLRQSDDLGWEFMQAGAMISIGILILAWLLPWGYVNDAASQVWSADNNPWVILENTWNRLAAVTGGYNAQNHGNFSDTLVLGGNPNLTNDIVFQVTSQDGTQYLESLSYDTYTGRGWTNGPAIITTIKPGDIYYDSSLALRSITQQVKVVNPPGEQNAYLLGASQVVSTNQPAEVLERKSDGTLETWLRTNGKLASGEKYTITSYVSAADISTLETVPLPKDAPKFTPNPNLPDLAPPSGYYEPNIVSTYTQLPAHLDPRIRAKALQVTASAKTMYDKAVALENFLRSNYIYDTNINLPPNAEGVSWFLFDSGKGFCNYFATAMAVMARELGMPARVVAGYTNGTYDAKTKQWIVRGSDAHAWTQIYFAQYGWINFEPSQSFATFNRPLHSTSVLPPLPIGGSSTGNTTTPKGRRDINLQGDTGLTTPLGGSQDAGLQVRKDVGIVLLALLIFIVGGLLYFSLWWRRLFKGYGLSAQIFGRMATLANWAGISPKRSQTPYEYAQMLSESVPESAVTIERLGDIYVRERWADPSSAEHPRRNGEVNELPGLWGTLQPKLFRYVLRHPHFLRKIPDGIGKFISQRRARRKRRRDELNIGG